MNNIFRNKKQRLQVVLDIAKKLVNFPKHNIGDYTTESPFIDLYNSDFEAFVKLKKEFNNYIYQDDNSLVSLSGNIYCPEINKTIHYLLPVKINNKPIFAFKVK